VVGFMVTARSSVRRPAGAAPAEMGINSEEGVRDREMRGGVGVYLREGDCARNMERRVLAPSLSLSLSLSIYIYIYILYNSYGLDVRPFFCPACLPPTHPPTHLNFLQELSIDAAGGRLRAATFHRMRPYCKALCLFNSLQSCPPASHTRSFLKPSVALQEDFSTFHWIRLARTLLHVERPPPAAAAPTAARVSTALQALSVRQQQSAWRPGPQVGLATAAAGGQESRLSKRGHRSGESA
jgi:hypothetical protein